MSSERRLSVVRCDAAREAHLRSETCIAPVEVDGLERGSYLLADSTVLADALRHAVSGYGYGVRD